MFDASRRIEDYFQKSAMPFFLWLRFITNQKIKQCHRRHLDVRKRSVKSQHHDVHVDDSIKINMVQRLVSREASPSSAAVPDSGARQVTLVSEFLPRQHTPLRDLLFSEQ